MTMFRPAKRENTPLIVGIAGPTKSGKTYSAHRLARGLAGGKPIAMINAEGARGHQYADKFQYITCDIVPPYRPAVYEAPVCELIKQDLGALIIDSMSHMHDGPGGMLEWHDELQEKMARRGTDNERDYEKKLERVTWAAWIEPKKAENVFVYRLLELNCPVILCFRAKEKLKIVPGKQPIDLGWQPIASDRVAFETLFTLVLPPHSKGVPDLSVSEMREPFDTMVPAGKRIDEDLGEKLRLWAAGSAPPPKAEAQTPGGVSTGTDPALTPAGSLATSAASAPQYITDDQVLRLDARCSENMVNVEALRKAAGVPRLAMIEAKDYERAAKWIDAVLASRKTK